MAGHLNAANYRWLTLIAEFDRRNGWVDNVTQSCAHWHSRLFDKVLRAGSCRFVNCRSQEA